VDVRTLTPDDLDLICHHREAMFRESGRDPALLQTMTAHFRPWLVPHLADGRYFGFIVSDGDKPIAGIGLMLIDWPPHPSHPEQDKRGYVLNVYVEPDYQKRGIAKRLMDRAEKEFRARGVAFAILHSTAMGRNLYAGQGWSGTTEMAKSMND
jgi:ribosomal protein S18 acetylase RimI-like enzyme